MLNKVFFREAIKQLKYRKFKSFIIIFSITIGISAFIGITSIGEGIRVKIINEIEESEDLTLIKVTNGDDDGTTIYITYDDVNYIKKIDNVDSAFVFVQDDYVHEDLDVHFYAVGIDSEDMSDVFDVELDEGEWFKTNTNETVIGSDLAEKFETQKGIGLNDNFTAKIRIYEGGGGYHDNVITFIIKGILDSVDYELNEKNINNLLFFDLPIAKELNEESVYDGVIVKSEDPKYSIEIVEEIEDELDLDASCAQEEIETANNFANLITLVLGFFSSLTLILGAVLIISITTISVYQRTTEIGTMKALGASNRNIIKLIIFECAILGLISGVCGVIGGIFFAILIDIIGTPIIASYLGTEFVQDFQLTIVTPQLLLIGFGLAFAICVLSGIPPALKASKLNPVEALKHI